MTRSFRTVLLDGRILPGMEALKAKRGHRWDIAGHHCIVEFIDE